MYPVECRSLSLLLKDKIPNQKQCRTCRRTYSLDFFADRIHLRPFWIRFPFFTESECLACRSREAPKQTLETCVLCNERLFVNPEEDVYRYHSIRYKIRHERPTAIRFCVDVTIRKVKYTVHYDCASQRNVKLSNTTLVHKQINDHHQSCVALYQALQEQMETYTLSTEQEQALTIGLHKLMSTLPLPSQSAPRLLSKNTTRKKAATTQSKQETRCSNRRCSRTSLSFHSLCKSCWYQAFFKSKDYDPSLNFKAVVSTKHLYDRARDRTVLLELISDEQLDRLYYHSKGQCELCNKPIDLFHADRLFRASIDRIHTVPFHRPYHQNVRLVHTQCNQKRLQDNVLEQYADEHRLLKEALAVCRRDPRAFFDNMINHFLQAMEYQTEYHSFLQAPNTFYHFQTLDDVEKVKKALSISMRKDLYSNEVIDEIYSSYRIVILTKPLVKVLLDQSS